MKRSPQEIFLPSEECRTQTAQGLKVPEEEGQFLHQEKEATIHQREATNEAMAIRTAEVKTVGMNAETIHLLDMREDLMKNTEEVVVGVAMVVEGTITILATTLVMTEGFLRSQSFVQDQVYLRAMKPTEVHPRHYLLGTCHIHLEKTTVVFYVLTSVMDLFEKCGKVASVSVPMDRITQNNKGYLDWCTDADLHLLRLRNEKMLKMGRQNMKDMKSKVENSALIGMSVATRRKLFDLPGIANIIKVESQGKITPQEEAHMIKVHGKITLPLKSIAKQITSS